MTPQPSFLIIFFSLLFYVSSVGADESVETYQVQFNPGWQMISLPLEPSEIETGYALSEVLRGSHSSIESIWTWEAELGANGGWLVYPPAIRQQLYGSQDTEHALTHLEVGKGYWLHSRTGGHFSIQGKRPSLESERNLNPNQFYMIGLSIVGQHSASILNEGAYRLISKAVGDFYLWGWNGQNWCVYTNRPTSITGINAQFADQGYLTSFTLCDSVSEGVGYWLQTFQGQGIYNLTFPLDPPHAVSNARGVAFVDISAHHFPCRGTEQDAPTCKTIFFLETDSIGPLAGVEIRYDADQQTLRFDKDGYRSLTLRQIDHPDKIKANSYNLVKLDTLTTKISNSSEPSPTFQTRAPADISISDSKATSRVLIKNRSHSQGIVLSVTPMTTIADVQPFEFHTLGTNSVVIAGLTTELTNPQTLEAYPEHYLSLTDWIGTVIPSITSNRFLKNGSQPVISPLGLDALLIEEGNNSEKTAIGQLTLAYFDLQDRLWKEAGPARIVALSEADEDKIQSNDAKNQGTTQLFRGLKGSYGLQPLEGFSGLTQIYPAYVFLFKSNKVASPCLQVRVMDREQNTPVKGAHVTINGQTQYATDAQGYLVARDGGEFMTPGTIDMTALLDSEIATINAVGAHHYADTIELETGTLQAHSHSSLICPNMVEFQLQRVDSTATITGLVERLEVNGNKAPLPNATMELKTPVVLNSAQVVARQDDSNDQLHSFEVGLDRTAKYLWQFKPTQTNKHFSILQKVCQDTTNCTPSPEAEEDGSLLGLHGGNRITRFQILDAILRNDFLAGNYQLSIQVEHCIPLLMDGTVVGSTPIAEEDRCARSEAEGGGRGGFQGKRFVETQADIGLVRVEFQTDKIQHDQTFNAKGKIDLLGGLNKPFYYGHGPNLEYQRVRYYVTFAWGDKNYPGSDTECDASKNNEYYLNPDAYTPDGSLNTEADAEIWKAAPKGPNRRCSAFITESIPLFDGDFVTDVITPLDYADDYGFLVKYLNINEIVVPEGLSEVEQVAFKKKVMQEHLLDTQVIRQLILDKFSELIRPIDERFSNVPSEPNPFTFLHDKMSIIVTAGFETDIKKGNVDGPKNGFVAFTNEQTPDGENLNEKQVNFALTSIFNIDLDRDNSDEKIPIKEALGITADELNPSSELPSVILTKTDAAVTPLAENRGTFVTRNFEFKGIPFYLSDTLYLTVQKPNFQISLQEEDGSPRLDLRFDQKPFGGNANGAIDGNELVLPIQVPTPVGHFEMDNTLYDHRLDVVTLNFLMEPHNTGNLKVTTFSRDPNVQSVPCTAPNEGCKPLSGVALSLGITPDTQAITRSNGQALFTKLLQGPYQLFATYADSGSEVGAHLPATASIEIVGNTTTEVSLDLIQGTETVNSPPYLLIDQVGIETTSQGIDLGVIRGDVFADDLGAPFSSDSTLALILNGHSYPRFIKANETAFSFNFPLSSGENRFTLQAFNHLGQNQPPLPLFQLNSTPSFRALSGRLLRQDQQTPIKNSLVQVSTEGFQTQATTDQQGYYRFDSLPAAQSVTVTATKCDESECYIPALNEVILGENETFVDFELTTKTGRRDISPYYPPSILMEISSDPIQSNTWRVFGTVTNTDAENLTLVLQNLEQVDQAVEQFSLPLTYLTEHSTRATFSTSLLLKTGLNRLQAHVLNSNNQIGYSRNQSQQIPYSKRETAVELRDLHLVKTNVGSVQVIVKNYYYGSEIKYRVRNKTFGMQQEDESVLVDSDNDGLGDTPLPQYAFADVGVPVNLVFDWSYIPLRSGTNRVEVSVKPDNDLDNDGKDSDFQEDLDSDGRLDPHNGSNYIGASSASPLQPLSDCEEGEYLGGEDTNCNGQLDIGEDLDQDGHFDQYDEDKDGDGNLDQKESALGGIASGSDTISGAKATSLSLPNFDLASSCQSAKSEGQLNSEGNTNNGRYFIDPDGSDGLKPFEVYCNMDHGGFTFLHIQNGLKTKKVSDSNSCQLLGLELFAPRTSGEFQLAKEYLQLIGRTRQMGPLGVYHPTRQKHSWDCGGCWTAHHAMNSNHAGSEHQWASTAGAQWWMSDKTTIAQPNGNYSHHHWLQIWYGDDGDVIAYNDVRNLAVYEDYLCMHPDNLNLAAP